MKNTSEKIVDAALHLFNKHGLSQVTLRTIAKELGISQGNLNYHYKKREDIIEEIYARLVEEMDRNMDKLNDSTIGLQLIFDLSTVVMQNTFKYRFLFLDFTQVMRENAKIRAHFKQLIEYRETQILGLFGRMVEEGSMRSELLPNEYLNLYKRIQIFGDFWMASAEVEKAQIEEKIINEYLEMIIQSIYPYLTAKGIEQYNSLSFSSM